MENKEIKATTILNAVKDQISSYRAATDKATEEIKALTEQLPDGQMTSQEILDKYQFIGTLSAKEDALRDLLRKIDLI